MFHLKTVQPNLSRVYFGLIKLPAVRYGSKNWLICPEGLLDKIFDHEKTVDYEKCVYVFSLADATDHASANRMCESSLVRPTGDCPECKGTLVSIHNQATNDFIINSVKSLPDHTDHPHWIGLRYAILPVIRIPFILPLILDNIAGHAHLNGMTILQ